MSDAYTRERGKRLWADRQRPDTMIARLRVLHDAGNVKRMHIIDTIREQRIGQHVYGAQCIAVELCRWNMLDPGPCLLTILYHDAPECVTGDVPAPTKAASPHVRAGLDMMENAFFDQFLLWKPYDVLRSQNMPHAEITEMEEAICKAADVLDLMQTAVQERRLGNRSAGLEVLFSNCLKYLPATTWVPGVTVIRDSLINDWSSYK